MGKDYQIITVKELHAAAECDSEAGTITIASDGSQPSNELLHTLIHELGHALFRRTGVSQGISTELEESIVDQYATMITEVFEMKLRRKATKPL